MSRARGALRPGRADPARSGARPPGGDVGVDPSQPRRELVVGELDEGGVGPPLVRQEAAPLRQVDRVLLDRFEPPSSEPRLAEGGLGGLDRRVPVEPAADLGEVVGRRQVVETPGEGPRSAPAPPAPARGAARGRRRPGRPCGGGRPTARHRRTTRDAAAGGGRAATWRTPRTGAAAAWRRIPWRRLDRHHVPPCPAASTADQMPVPAPTSTTGPGATAATASTTSGSYGAVCVTWWRACVAVALGVPVDLLVRVAVASAGPSPGHHRAGAGRGPHDLDEAGPAVGAVAGGDGPS